MGKVARFKIAASSMFLVTTELPMFLYFFFLEKPSVMTSNFLMLDQAASWETSKKTNTNDKLLDRK